MNIRQVGLLAISMGFCSCAIGTDYYVSPQGTDRADGTAERPWGTLEKANATVSPGDTIVLMGGTYSESIAPSRSGILGSPIRYVGQSGAKVVLASANTSGSRGVAIDLTQRSHVEVNNIVVDGKAKSSTPALTMWVKISNGSHNVIRDSTLKNAKGWSGILIDGKSQYNRIVNNRIDYAGNYENNYGELINLKYPASNNLIDRNHLSRGGHNLIKIGSFNNVIANNLMDNDWSSVGGKGAGYRSIALVADNGNGNFGYNLFENNVVTGAGFILKSPRGQSGAPAMKVSGVNQIIRRNFVHRNGQDGIFSVARATSPLSKKHKIYNNVFFKNGGPSWALWHMWDSSSAVEGNVFINNVLYKNRQNPKVDNYDADLYLNFGKAVKPMSGLRFSGNVIAQDQGRRPIVWVRGVSAMNFDVLQSRYPENFSSNRSVAPGFVSDSPAKMEDLRLRAGSELIDGGVHLTETRGGGSGRRIVVRDAGYFSDGFGLIEGDAIQIGVGGSARSVTVVRVDYNNDTLVVDRDTNWRDGEPLNLAISGSAPDVGVSEVRREDVQLADPTGLKIERPEA